MKRQIEIRTICYHNVTHSKDAPSIVRTNDSKVSNERRMWRSHSTEGPQANQLLRRTVSITVNCIAEYRVYCARNVRVTRQLSSTPQPGRCPAKHFVPVSVLVYHSKKY